MIRFFLILLLAAVALSQFVPRPGINAEGDAGNWDLVCDESEPEKAGKPDYKTQGDDKIHHDNQAHYAFSFTLPTNLAPGSQPLHISFYDQPNTPPPNLFL